MTDAQKTLRDFADSLDAIEVGSLAYHYEQVLGDAAQQARRSGLRVVRPSESG